MSSRGCDDDLERKINFVISPYIDLLTADGVRPRSLSDLEKSAGVKIFLEHI